MSMGNHLENVPEVIDNPLINLLKDNRKFFFYHKITVFQRKRRKQALLGPDRCNGPKTLESIDPRLLLTFGDTNYFL